MKKILFLNFGDTINIAGGATKILCEMANEFCDRGYEISVICCDNTKGSLYFPLNKDVNFININRSKPNFFKKVKREYLRLFHKLNNEKMFNDIYYNSTVRNELLEHIIIIKPDIIISFDFQSLAVLEKLKEQITIPIIEMIHTGAKYIFNDSISDFHKKVYNYPQVIQVLTEKDINIVQNVIKRPKVICISNVVNVPDKYEKDNSKSNNLIIHLGRIIEGSKRQLLLVKAFNIIKEEFPEWKIEMWGGFYSKSQEQYKLEIEKFIKDNLLQDRVKFMGETNNPFSELQKADIFAFPSKKEGFGLALAEAMAVGLPAIGYRSCSGVNTLIKDGFNGFLVNDGIDDFADKLSILIKNEELRIKMGENAKTSMKNFTPEIIWNKWENLILELCGD